ncbi:MAG: hypothetical protein AB8I08_19885 [Sandaracinaceae bacterium]
MTTHRSRAFMLRVVLSPPVTALLVVSLVGCAPGLDDPERFESDDCVGFDVPRDLFAARCGSGDCHDAFEPAAGMDLVSGGVEDRLAGVESSSCVGERRIDPHDAARSFLLTRVSPDPSCRGEDIPRMPLDGTALEPRELACLEAWVMEVAARTQDRVPPRTDAGAPVLDAGSADGGAADAGLDSGVPPGDGG